MGDFSHIPHHLRQFVVEQDYAQYTAIDQAVWRFVLLQLHQRLAGTAHPAYAKGLADTGISVERIPRIDEMNACLERFGWSAVCVDGFIPPRAFQEFQAASVLPIAADVRTKEHLVYTPAPDIIHEAAGHAPILPAARYAAYLRAIGEVSKKAFSSPEDTLVDAAIFELSEVKETPGARADAIARAEAGLRVALAQVTAASEASRLSRLYWWTAEYGLVGTPRDYKLYGAGLLSSLAESHSCQDRGVKKLVLSAACVEQAYDITCPQPQLYVARDFEQLFDVLRQVEVGLSHHVGGDAALAAALASAQLATLHFSDGGFIIGELSALSGGAQQGVLSFRGRVGVGRDGDGFETFGEPNSRYSVPVGALANGRELRELREAELRAEMMHGRLRLRFAGGLELDGELEEYRANSRGGMGSLRLKDYQLRSERAGLSERGEHYLLCASGQVITAHAGSIAPEFFVESLPSGVRVPKPRTFQAREQALLDLYERAVTSFRDRLGSSVVAGFTPIVAELTRSFPDEWLLRWNLLECLHKLGEQGSLARSLVGELEALEIRFSHREPIASGLRYLLSLAA